MDAEAEPFCRFAVADELVRLVYYDFDGRRFGATWRAPRITAADEADATAVLPDFGLLGTIPVVSEAAAKVLEPYTSSDAELLPLRYSRKQYYALNVTTVLDVLDEDRSILKRFRDGSVMEVTKFCINGAAIGKHAFFRIPQLLRAFVFTTEEVVSAVSRSKLTGFKFEPTCLT